MATWSVTPSVPHTGNTFNFPKNTGTTNINYTITYVDDNNCSVSTTYTVPSGSTCQPVTCTCEDLVFDESQVSFPTSGGTQTKAITSSCGVITVSSNAAWCTATTNGSVITLTASDNSSGSESRTGTITVMQDGQCNKTFPIYQSYEDCEYAAYHNSLEIHGLHNLNTSLSFSLDFEIGFNTTSGNTVLCDGQYYGNSLLYGTVSTTYSDTDIKKHLECNASLSNFSEFNPYIGDLTDDYLNPQGLESSYDENVNLRVNGGEVLFEHSSTENVSFWWGVGNTGYANRCEFYLDEETALGGNTELIFKPKSSYSQYNFLSVTVYISYTSAGGFISITIDGLGNL